MVARIPAGRVATYGQIAALAGLVGRSAARQAGYALAAMPADTNLPWHRVVNASGRVSERGDPDRAEYQRVLLEAEGVVFGIGLTLDLERFGWRP